MIPVRNVNMQEGKKSTGKKQINELRLYEIIITAPWGVSVLNISNMHCNSYMNDETGVSGV